MTIAVCFPGPYSDGGRFVYMDIWFTALVVCQGTSIYLRKVHMETQKMTEKCQCDRGLINKTSLFQNPRLYRKGILSRSPPSQQLLYSYLASLRTLISSFFFLRLYISMPLDIFVCFIFLYDFLDIAFLLIIDILQICFKIKPRAHLSNYVLFLCFITTTVILKNYVCKHI